MKTTKQLAIETWNVLQRIERGEVALTYVDGDTVRHYRASNGWQLGVFYDGGCVNDDWDYVEYAVDVEGNRIEAEELADALGWVPGCWYRPPMSVILGPYADPEERLRT